MSESAASVATPAAPVENTAPTSDTKPSVTHNTQTNGKSVPTATEAKAELKELAEDNMDSMVKIKVNGQVKTMTVAEALKRAEKADGADEKFQRASQIEKQNQQFRQWAQAAKANPEIFFKEFGIDPDEFSQARLAKYMQDQMMTPEQREAAELREYKIRKEAEDKEREDNLKKDKESVEYQKADQSLRNEIFESWQASGLPAHPSFGIEIAKTLVAAKEQGLNWTAKEAASRVKEDYLNNTGQVFEQMDAEAIHKLLPKAVLKKIREYDVARVTGQSAPKNSSQKSPGSQPASAGKKMLSEKEYNEYFRNKSNG